MYRKIERVLGNLRDFPLEGREIERVPVASDAMTRRLLRLSSSLGDLGIVFADGERLRDGDVLVAEPERVIAIELLPDDVLVAYPHGIGEALELGHALGNRHIPMLHEGDAVIVGYAAPLQELCERLGVRCERTRRVLERPFVHAAAPHVHG
jgi:urease accessory protein